MTPRPSSSKSAVSTVWARGLAAEARAVAHEYSPAERLVDNIIHVVGVVASVIAVTALITLASVYGDGWTIASVVIYGIGVVIVFLASAAYHMIHWPQGKWLLRRVDHAAIFLKIAGTYTPFAAISLGGGAWGAALLGSVWSIAAVGVPLKLFAPGRLEKLAVWLYLLQGWLVVVAFGPLAAAISSTALSCLVAGGVLYTVGVVFFLWEKLPYHNAIWHGFVLAASGCMYAAIMNGVALA